MATHAPVDPGTIIYIKDWLTLVALVAGPVIGVLVTLWYQRRAEKRAAKQRLFLTLMAHRKSNPPVADWVNALNLIDVVFAKSPRVVAAWHNLYQTANIHPMPIPTWNHHYLTLLSIMAQEMGYRRLEQVDIDQFYAPIAHGEIAAKQQEVQTEFLRILKASKNFSEPKA